VKKFLLALLVLVLLYPAVPWVLGRTIEQRVAAYTDQLQEQMPYVSIIQTRFTRGWFTSDQEITLGGGAPVPGLPGGVVTIHNVIHHGPICGFACLGLARVDTHFVFPAGAQASIAKVFGKAEPVSIQTRLHLLGGLTTTLASPPLADVALDDGGHVASSGLTLTIDEAAAAERLAMRGNLAQLRYRGHGGVEIELDGAAFSSNSQRLLRSLYSGDAAFNLEKFALSGLPQGAATLNDLHLTTRTRADAGLLTVSIAFGSGPIATKPLRLASTEFDFSYRHLNAEALESLTAALGLVNHDGAIAPADRGQRLAAVLRDKAPALLLQAPEFTVDKIRLRNDTGALQITGSLRLVGFVAADLAPAADPKALLQKLRVDVDLACDQAFLASLPNGALLTAQLQAFVQQGLATRDNGQFHSKLEFAAGKLTFNGRAPPTPPTPVAPPSPVAPTTPATPATPARTPRTASTVTR
jgi:uncharacterized protein YdgA (DUF945 family)